MHLLLNWKDYHHLYKLGTSLNWIYFFGTKSVQLREASLYFNLLHCSIMYRAFLSFVVPVILCSVGSELKSRNARIPMSSKTRNGQNLYKPNFWHTKILRQSKSCKPKFQQFKFLSIMNRNKYINPCAKFGLIKQFFKDNLSCNCTIYMDRGEKDCVLLH